MGLDIKVLVIQLGVVEMDAHSGFTFITSTRTWLRLRYHDHEQREDSVEDSVS